MFDHAQIVFVAVGGAIVLISALMWLLALDRLAHGQPLLESVPRRAVPWSLGDLLLVGIAGVVVLAITQWVSLQLFDLPQGEWELTDLTARQQIGVLVAFSASSLVTGLAAMGVCRWRSQATSRDLGWDGTTWLRDLSLGVGGYIMLIVPVLSVHFLAQWVFPSDENHPFIDLIMDDPQIAYLAPIAFAALIAAPMVEEFFFRVLLQGWLERLTSRMEAGTRPGDSTDGTSIVLKEELETSTDGTAIVLGSGDSAEPETSADGTAIVLGSGDSAEPETSADGTAIVRAGGEPAMDATGLPEQRWLRRMVIGISSLAFAMAHFGQGPAPISLFVLALGLGYLYQRTHRILPCIVVHFLVNLTAVIQLAVAILEGQS